jgi:hypothetical protein
MLYGDPEASVALHRVTIGEPPQRTCTYQECPWNACRLSLGTVPLESAQLSILEGEAQIERSRSLFDQLDGLQ